MPRLSIADHALSVAERSAAYRLRVKANALHYATAVRRPIHQSRPLSGEILQPLITLIGPYSLHPPAPHGAAVGLTDLHCEDQEQPDHADQIANPAQAYAAFGALPRGKREIFTPMEVALLS